MTEARIDHELGQSAIKALRFLAWIFLLGGIAGAIFVLSQFGTVEVQGRFSTTTETDPVAVALSITIFLQSALACAFLIVICYVAENVAGIQEKLVPRRPTDEPTRDREEPKKVPEVSRQEDRSSQNPDWKWRCSNCGGPVRVNYGSGEEAICKLCAEAS